MWSTLIATASDASRNFKLNVIFNPASGPGSSRDPNYLTDSGTGPLTDLRSAGGIMHGYVATSFGSRPLVDVQSDIDAYLTGIYAGFIDGIFFDEMSNDLANVAYYQQLQSYVKGISPVLATFGNPGTTFVTNPLGQATYSADDYINSLDTIVVFENSASEYANNYTSFSYLDNLDPRRLAHIVHTQSAWNPSLLGTAAARGAGYVYFTDDVFSQIESPYDKFPAYWTQFTQDVSAYNVPELPASVLIPGAWAVVWIGRRKLLRGSR
jgi:hypothetical protein